MNFIHQVFERINNSGIKYCHWKSNANLERSFEGLTDFDLLIDKRNSVQLQKILLELNFKRRVSTANKVYTGMEDYIGFDDQTGTMYHFHLHYQLILGRQYSKNYVLPLMDITLKTAIKDKNYPIMISRPVIELFFLCVRVLLKTPMTPKILGKFLLKKSIFPKNIVTEFAYLRQVVDDGELENFLQEISIKTDLKTFLDSGPDEIGLATFLQLKHGIVRELKNFQRFSLKEQSEQFRIKRASAKNSRSWLTRGGVTIGFLGCDGSGKSSTVATISKWLAWKLSVETVYMGMPKSDKRLQVIRKMARLFNKLGMHKLRQKMQRMGHLLVAKKRYELYLRCNQLKRQGKIVIFDRYPLQELWEMEIPMDGPRIKSTTHPDSARERDYYLNINPPDYLFIMKVSIEESISRKPDLHTEENKSLLIPKITAVNQLIESNQHENFITIDTMKDQQDVILEVKKLIWEVI